MPITPAPVSTFDACPACRYPLTGLPAAGRCPECGNPYTPEDILLPAAASDRSVVTLSRAAVAFSNAMSGLTLAALGLLQYWGGHDLVRVLMIISGLSLLFVMALGAWRGWWQRFPLLLYLTDRGFGAGRARRGVAKLHPWSPGLEIDFRKTRAGWTCSIRRDFGLHVKVWLNVSDDRIPEIRDKLQAWQPSRVCVER